MTKLDHELSTKIYPGPNTKQVASPPHKEGWWRRNVSPLFEQKSKEAEQFVIHSDTEGSSSVQVPAPTSWTEVPVSAESAVSTPIYEEEHPLPFVASPEPDREPENGLEAQNSSSRFGRGIGAS